MASVPTENLEAYEKRRELSQYCLGLPPILRQILRQFSNYKLKELSFVNKLWNAEARSVMRERENLRGNISNGARHEDDPCRKLVAFASDLEQMPVVPFTGLHISIYQRGACKLFPNEALDQSYRTILDLLTWKHFSVRFCTGWEGYKDCPALQLAKLILQEHCGTLEELILGNAKDELLRPLLQDRNMSRLKYLKTESRYFGPADHSLSSNFIKGLVSCAPNLQELHVDKTTDLIMNVLEGSSAVLVPKFRFRPLLTPICEGLISSLRAQAIEIIIQKERTDPELLNRFIPAMLQASRTTLMDLRMDLLFAVPLMCYGTCLENVTKLKIHINYVDALEQIEPSILELPAGLDFTRVFPKLNKVTIFDHYDLNGSSDVVSAFVEQANRVLSRASPDRAVKIKILKIDQVSLVRASTLRILSQMFPDVKKVHTRALQRLPFTLLRQHFLCLEEVDERRAPGPNLAGILN